MTTVDMPVMKVTDALIEQWVKGCEVVSSLQAQAETMTRSFLDQNQAARQEGQKLALQMADQARENQRLFQEMVQSTVRLSLESYRLATSQTVSELQKQVEQLTRQVEQLSKVKA